METTDTNNEDYYFNESGLLVFTEKYHLKRGYCCTNGCTHCPYGYKKIESLGANKDALNTNE